MAHEVQTEGLNLPLIRLWIDDLLTPGLRKTRGLLEKISANGALDGNCCLGRACRVAIAQGYEVDARPAQSFTVFDEDHQLMPLSVQRAFGFNEKNPTVIVEFEGAPVLTCLAALNDGTNQWGIEMSLPEVAEVIKKNFLPEG